MPSLGRAKEAHLNLSARHCFGEFPHLRIICVEPHEQIAYRQMWPDAILMILPESNQVIILSFVAQARLTRLGDMFKT
jgi:hypothetical protein